VRQQSQLGQLDFLVVEGVMGMMQWTNRGGEQEVDVQSLANHRWKEFLVTWTHGEGLGYRTSYDVLGNEVFLVGAERFLDLLS
jgi:hypothetical protein